MAAGNEKPQVSRHVRDVHPPNGLASKMERQEVTVASGNPVGSALVARKHASRFSSEGTRYTCKTRDAVIEPADSATEAQRDPEDLKIDTTALDTDDPQRFQSSPMSRLLPLDNKNSEGVLSSNRDNAPLEARDLEAARSLDDSPEPKASASLAPGKFPGPGTGQERNEIRPPSGKNGEAGHSAKGSLNGISQCLPDNFHDSVPNTYPLAAPSNASNDFMAAQLYRTVGTQPSGPFTDGWYYDESILDDVYCYAPPADIPARQETSDQRTRFAHIPNQPQFSSGSQLRPTEQAELPNHPLPDSDIRPHSELDLIPSYQSEVIPEEPTYSQPIREEEIRPESMMDEASNPEPTSVELDFPQAISDEQGSPNTISETQSRSKSIKRDESPSGRDHPPKVSREAKLPRLRWRSLKTRARVSEMRVELQQSREEMSDADAEFVTLCRQSWISGSHNELAIQASFKKLQATRDAYGPLEEAYDTLEERLDREEYELAELEEMMLLDSVPLTDIHDSDQESHHNSSNKSGSATMEGFKEQQNPLYKEYASRIGDASLLREAYSYLSTEHYTLLEAQEVSERFGTKMQAEDETRLAMFYAKEAKMIEELRQTDADVQRLRQDCVKIGLLSTEGGDEIDLLPSSDESIGTEQTEYNRYSQLLDQPGKGEDERRSKQLLSRFRSGDTGDRITRWLLHKLRSSCSEVELLARYADGLDQIDSGKWQEEVLYFWFMDSANLPPSAYELDPTITAAPSSGLTDLNKAPNNTFGEKQFIQLTVRSSSLSRSLEFSLLLKLVLMKGRSAISNVR